MNELKEDRIEILNECMKKLKEVCELYKREPPAWIILHNAWGQLNSVHYLETNTNFDEETLAPRFKIDEIEN